MLHKYCKCLQTSKYQNTYIASVMLSNLSMNYSKLKLNIYGHVIFYRELIRFFFYWFSNVYTQLTTFPDVR